MLHRGSVLVLAALAACGDMTEAPAARADAAVAALAPDAAVAVTVPDADAAAIAPDAAPAASGDAAPGPQTQPQPGHSFLTRYGGDVLSVQTGATTTLEVRFANENGVPLAGTVTFRIEGDSGGSTVEPSAAPDFNGTASSRLVAGQPYKQFRVV